MSIRIDKMERIALENAYAELQTYSEKQFKTLAELQKKNKELLDKVTDLQALINGTLIPTDLNALGVSNEQAICEKQLKDLQNLSLVGSLTMEQTRQVQIYTELLLKIKEASKKVDNTQLDKLTEEELLKVINTDTTLN